MRIQTKRNLLRAATAAAVLCAAAVVLLPAAASAAPAVASGAVNVRSGPSTSFAILDTLYRGETVDVQGCRIGWCYITHSGPDGFVSASFLRAGNVVMPPNFNLSFNFPQGSITLGIGDTGPDVIVDPGPGFGRACFYSRTNYNGASFCMERGQQVVYVGPTWNNRISSIRNSSGLRVRVCDDSGYDICRTYTTSARYLGDFNNVISSIQVR